MERGIKAIIYGVPGVGKTTLAAQFPAPYILDLEHGAERYNVPCNSDIETFQIFKQVLKNIPEGTRTLVIDTFDELFPDTKPSQVIRMFGSLSEECAVLRKASAHIIHLQQNIRPPKKSERALSKLEREKNIVNMYNEGHSIDDIFAISGFTSRSSVFRILNKHGVTLNRGPHSGPLKKRNKE